MRQAPRVALVGDYDAAVTAHRAIQRSLELAEASYVWVHTTSIPSEAAAASDFLSNFDGIWCVPASPYAHTDGALAAIQVAREQRRPFLGSCGGFQHAVIEYARNALGIAAAGHAETDPEAAGPLVVAALACPLVEESEQIRLTPGARIFEAYGGQETITETYRCRFGVNRLYAERLFGGGVLLATAHDQVSGEVRGAELAGSLHPFFVITLFQSERRALAGDGEVPPLVSAFLAAAASASRSS